METVTDTRKQDLTIVGSLREMEVGDTLEFPPAKTDYLRNLVSQRLVDERLSGMRWRVSLDFDAGITLVERTA